MKKFAVRFFEILSLVLLCVFLLNITGEDTYSDKSVADIEKTVISSMNIDSLGKIKENKLKETFGFDMSEIKEYTYYAADEIMDVRELLIIKLKENASGEELISAIDKRVGEKQALFEGYAPEEGAMLKNHVLKKEKGFIFYAVGKDASSVAAAFSETIK